MTDSVPPAAQGAEQNSGSSPWLATGITLLALALVGFLFRDALYLMENWWSQKEEYNHGYLIPVVAAYLLLLLSLIHI